MKPVIVGRAGVDKRVDLIAAGMTGASEKTLKVIALKGDRVCPARSRV
ncbi:MAG: hypothetical protein WCP22_13485 [Chlamydiota bacterium]